MSPLFLVDYVLGKMKSTPEDRAISIPYDDLWRSAIRCKLISEHHRNMGDLWKLAHEPKDNVQTMDSNYLHELCGATEPVHYDTIHTTSYLWHTLGTVYITFRVDRHVEKKFLKKQNRLIGLSGCICVNRFFYHEMLTILRPTLAYIKRMEPKRLVISGYSTGGILVQIISGVLGQMFPHMHVCCHTFGSPKAGNHAFAKWFCQHVQEHYRIVNGHDPVTMYPFDCNWSHVYSTTLQFDWDSHINILQQEPPWYRRLWTRLFITRRILKQHRYDHDFDAYIARLWRYVRIAKYIEES